MVMNLVMKTQQRRYQTRKNMGETITNNKKDTLGKKIMSKGMISMDKIGLIGGFYV